MPLLALLAACAEPAPDPTGPTDGHTWDGDPDGVCPAELPYDVAGLIRTYRGETVDEDPWVSTQEQVGGITYEGIPVYVTESRPQGETAGSSTLHACDAGAVYVVARFPSADACGIAGETSGLRVRHHPPVPVWHPDTPVGAGWASDGETTLEETQFDDCAFVQFSRLGVMRNELVAVREPPPDGYAGGVAIRSVSTAEEEALTVYAFGVGPVFVRTTLTETVLLSVE